METNPEGQFPRSRGERFGSLRGGLPSCQAAAQERFVFSPNRHGSWMPSSDLRCLEGEKEASSERVLASRAIPSWRADSVPGTMLFPFHAVGSAAGNFVNWML